MGNPSDTVDLGRSPTKEHGMRLLDEIAHPEQCRIWASEITADLVFAGVLKKPESYEEVIELGAIMVGVAREMAEKVLRHPAHPHAQPQINWRDEPSAIVEDDTPMIGRDYE